MPGAALAIPPATTEAREAPQAAPAPWTEQDLHDYIASQIKARGRQLPCPESMVIARGFRERFGPVTASRIAMAAFGPHGGIWQGAPVTWRRFRASHDDFFGRPIQGMISG